MSFARFIEEYVAFEKQVRDCAGVPDRKVRLPGVLKQLHGSGSLPEKALSDSAVIFEVRGRAVVSKNPEEEITDEVFEIMKRVLSAVKS